MNGREIVEILEAYDLTGSYRAAAEPAGCDHHTVARYVKLRAEGRSCHTGPSGAGMALPGRAGAGGGRVSRGSDAVRAVSTADWN